MDIHSYYHAPVVLVWVLLRVVLHQILLHPSILHYLLLFGLWLASSWWENVSMYDSSHLVKLCWFYRVGKCIDMSIIYLLFSRFEPLRNWTLWKHLNDYFPLTVVKTCDIPTDRNYLFCFYPHGVLSANALVHFTSNGSDFHTLYPGFATYFATLDFHFRTPFLRDFLISLGELD